jgi:hypothetical protein
MKMETRGRGSAKILLDVVECRYGRQSSGCTLAELSPRLSTWMDCLRAQHIVAQKNIGFSCSTGSKVQKPGQSPVCRKHFGRLNMKDLLERCMGLDIHKESVVACLMTGPLDCKAEKELRTFGTLSANLLELRRWVEETNCRYVAMESTGIYLQPVYETLEDCFGGDIELLVVNARHMKNVPGKKTDMRDAEWIATLLRAGLLNGSFIP